MAGMLNHNSKFADGGLQKISSGTFLANVELINTDDPYDFA